VCSSSYLHCEWATEQQLEKDKRIQQKIKRFKIKQAQKAHFFADVRMPVFVCNFSKHSVLTKKKIFCRMICRLNAMSFSHMTIIITGEMHRIYV